MEKVYRRIEKAVSEIKLGATGSVVKGDVLDVNPDYLQRKLQDYEPRLYLRWNPRKNRGYGTWELRIRPDKKRITERVFFGGNTISVVEFKESEFEHHVKDFDILGYNILQWIRDADMWAAANYSADKHHRLNQHLYNQDEAHFKYLDDQKAKLRDEAIYRLKQERSTLQDFQNRILSGVNPNLLSAFWGRK